MIRNNHKKIIIVLAVLLAVVSVALAAVLLLGKDKDDTSVSKGNVVGYVEETVSIATVKYLAEPQTEALTLSEEGSETVTPFNVSDMLPGDSYTKIYKISINDSSAQTLVFSGEYFDQTQNPTAEQTARDRSLMTISVKMDGNDLVSQNFDTIADTNCPLDENTVHTFAITVTLDKSAGNEYASLTQIMNFKWVLSYKQTFSVTYTDGVEGETVFEDKVIYIKDGEATPAYPDGTPEREGYKFLGWEPEQSETVTEDVIYKAIWTQYYTVIYTDGVDGEAFADKSFGNLLIGDDTPAFGDNPSRDGYTFEGWLPEVTEKVEGNITYTAQWKEIIPEEKTYTVIYSDGANGKVFKKHVYKGLKEGDPTPKFNGTPSRDGYDFLGWNPEIAETVTKNVTYTAKWKKNTPDVQKYTVTYVDGLDGEIFKDQTYTVEEGKATPSFNGTPEREGYIFTGWSPDVSDKVYQNITYTAKWEKEIIATYTVIYTDGKDGKIFADQKYEGLKLGDKTPSFTGSVASDGYIFKGWLPTVSEFVEGNITYTAQWKEVGSESIILTEEEPEKTVDVDISNPDDGEKWISKYHIIINDDDIEDLNIKITIPDGADDIAKDLTVKIVRDDNGETIYEGKLSDIPDELKTSLTGEYGEKLTLTVSVTLDGDTDGKYKDFDGKLGITFGIKPHGKCRCILCRIIRYFGGPYCICPWCWIILIIILLTIAFIIYRIIKKKKDKDKKKEENQNQN